MKEGKKKARRRIQLLIELEELKEFVETDTDRNHTKTALGQAIHAVLRYLDDVEIGEAFRAVWRKQRAENLAAFRGKKK